MMVACVTIRLINDNILLDAQYIIVALMMLNLCCAIQELDRGLKPSPAPAL